MPLLSTIWKVQSIRQDVKNVEAIAAHNIEVVREQTRQKAESLRLAGREKQRQVLEERRIVLARNRAKFGKAGVTLQGSPLIVQQEVAKNITLDAVMEGFNTQVKIQAVKSRGQSIIGAELLKTSAARKAGKLQVGQAIFSGATQALTIAAAG